jgi:hypothetical protein
VKPLALQRQGLRNFELRFAAYLSGHFLHCLPRLKFLQHFSFFMGIAPFNKVKIWVSRCPAANKSC